MEKRNTIRALCVGWICAGATVIVTHAVQLPFATSLVMVFIAGVAPTLYILNQE